MNDESDAIIRWEGILGEFLRAAAHSLARGHHGLEDGLYQEALIELWTMDPRRFDDDDIAFLKRALRNRMLNVLRAERHGGMSGRSEVQDEARRKIAKRPRHGSRPIPITRRERKCA